MPVDLSGMKQAYIVCTRPGTKPEGASYVTTLEGNGEIIELPSLSEIWDHVRSHGINKHNAIIYDGKSFEALAL